MRVQVVAQRPGTARGRQIRDGSDRDRAGRGHRMLPILLLGLSIALIAAAGTGTIWMILTDVLPPSVAVIGAVAVIACCAMGLTLLAARQRMRRLEGELHAVRRSRSLREREPIRYPDEEAEAAGLPPLAAASDAGARADGEARAPGDGGEEADGSARAEDARSLAVRAALGEAPPALFLEPVVAMPENDVIAYRARPGLPGVDDGHAGSGPPNGTDADGLAPFDPAGLGDGLRARVDLATVRGAIALAASGLDARLECDASAALLSDRLRLREVLRAVEEMETLEGRNATIAFRVRTADLDAVAGGRLEDLTEAGATLIEAGADPADLDRADIAELAARGIGALAFSASSLAPGEGTAESGPDARTVRGIRLLLEHGIVPIAADLTEETRMVALAELGVSQFSGPLVAPVRRVRRELTTTPPEGTGAPSDVAGALPGDTGALPGDTQAPPDREAPRDAAAPERPAPPAPPRAAPDRAARDAAARDATARDATAHVTEPFAVDPGAPLAASDRG